MLMFKVAFSLFSITNQSACSTLDWVVNNQSDFDYTSFQATGISKTVEDNSNVNMPFLEDVVNVNW